MRARAVMFAMGASLLMGMPAVGFAQDAKTDPNALMFEDACSSCHAADLVEKEPRSKDAWTHLVDEMINKGAIVSDEDRPKLIDYLVKYWGTDGAAPAAAAATPPADPAAAPSATPPATP